MEAGKTGAPKDIKFNRLFRAGIEVLVFAALVVITTLLLRPLQTLMHKRITDIRDEFIYKGEALLNRKIEYASAGFSIFSIIDIRNIRVTGGDGEPVIAVARLRVSYSLWKLLLLDFDGLLESVRFDEPSIMLDFKRDSDLIALFNGGKDSDAAKLQLPKDLRLNIQNGRAEIRKDRTVFRIAELFFNGGIKDDRIRFDTRWETFASLDNVIFGQGVDGKMRSRINGNFSTNFENGNIIIRIPSLSSDLFDIKPIMFSLVAGDRKIDLRKINDRLPFDFSFEYDLDSASFSGMLECEGFLPGALIGFEGSWQGFNRWLGTRISGSASLGKDTAGRMSYNLDLYGTAPPYLNSGPIAYKVSAQGDGDRIKFDDLSVNISQGQFRYRGGFDFKPLLPWGSITFSNVSLSGAETVNGTIGIESHDNTVSLSGKDFAVGKTILSKLDITLLHNDEGVNFSVVTESSQGHTPKTQGRLGMEAAVDFNPRHIEASFRLDEFLLSDLIEMARPFVPASALPGIPEFAAKGIGITTEVFFTTNFEQLLYNAPGFKLSYQDQGLEIFASLSGTDRRFELNEGRIIWQDEESALTCFADFSNPLDIIFSLDASYADISYHLEGTILDRRFLTVLGSYGFNIMVTTAEEGNYSGDIRVSRLPIPFRKQMVQFSMVSSFRFDSPQSWSAGINEMEILNIAGPVSPINIRLSGEADQNGLALRELSYDDGLGLLTGNFSLSWDKTFSDYRTSLTLNNRLGTEGYGLEGSFIGKHLDMAVHSSGMQVNRILKDIQHSYLNAEAQIQWDSWDNFTAEITVPSFSARIKDTNLNFSVSASLTADEFLLQGLTLRYDMLEAQLPSLRINRREGKADTAARIQGKAGGRELDTGFSLKADFNPIASWFDIAQAANSFNGELTIEDIRFDEIKAPEPFGFYFSRSGSLISLEGGPQNMMRLQVLDGGDFYAGLSNPSPIRGSVIGNIGKNNIEAESSDLYVDLKALWNFIPPVDNIIKLEGGYVTAALKISGPFGDPEFFGTARGQSVKIGIPRYLREPVRPVPFDITINGNEMNFKPVPARVGNGMGIVAGSFIFDRWIPNIFSLDIKVGPETPVPFGFDIAGVIARGDVSGNMIISMEDMNLSVIGDLIAQDTEISLNTNELNSPQFDDTASRPGSIGTVIDIGVKTGKKVEFVWPSREFPVLQAYADMGTGLRISNDSLARTYALLGDVHLRSGEIFYFERSFYLREGTLFFNENQLKFDPRISARAEIRDRGDEGPVTISLIIDNSPLKSFTARFVSNPPLSQLEIFSLLGQNMAGSSSSENKQPIELINSTADVLMQFQVIRRMEREIRNFLNLDMFSIRTQVLQNAVLQATGLRDPVDRINRVGNYFDNTTVFLGKYIGSNMFIQSMFTLRYDENKSEWAGMTIEPDIGVELRGPLFDVRMNLVPLHPENLYVDDLSFTLTWRRSF